MGKDEEWKDALFVEDRVGVRGKKETGRGRRSRGREMGEEEEQLMQELFGEGVEEVGPQPPPSLSPSPCCGRACVCVCVCVSMNVANKVYGGLWSQ